MTIRLTEEEMEEIQGLIDFFENDSNDVSCFVKIKNIIDNKDHIEDIDPENIRDIKEQLCDVKEFFENIHIDTDLIKRLIFIFSVF